jgi:S-(hydroxymethyl)glutathione dehydrogenase/alcohol dehydrogenase
MIFNAAVLRSAGLALDIAPVRLSGLSDTDVVVRVMATSLCHTDLEAQEGGLDCPMPIVPGHEAAGVVDWVGSAVSRVAIGDHVIISWNPHCGACFYCDKRQPILCQQYRDHASLSLHFDGKPRLFLKDEPLHQLMYAGTFAEIAVVTESCAIPVSKSIPFDRACLIGCGVMTGVGAALNVAKIDPGSSASIIGCGAVGLSVIQGARLAQANRIIAIDRDPSKLELARTFGATHTLLADDDLFQRHAELTSGRGADYVFEAAGRQSAFFSSIEIVRPGGQVVWLGKMAGNQSLSLRWGAVMGEKKIRRASYGGANPAQDFPKLVQSYLDGQLLLDEYITSRISLGEVNVGLDRLKRGLEIRSVIEFE